MSSFKIEQDCCANDELYNAPNNGDNLNMITLEHTFNNNAASSTFIYPKKTDGTSLNLTGKIINPIRTYNKIGEPLTGAGSLAILLIDNTTSTENANTYSVFGNKNIIAYGDGGYPPYIGLASDSNDRNFNGNTNPYLALKIVSGTIISGTLLVRLIVSDY